MILAKVNNAAVQSPAEAMGMIVDLLDVDLYFEPHAAQASSQLRQKSNPVTSVPQRSHVAGSSENEIPEKRIWLCRRPSQQKLTWGLMLGGDTLVLKGLRAESVADGNTALKGCLGMILSSVNKRPMATIVEVERALQHSGNVAELLFLPNATQPGVDQRGAPEVGGQLSRIIEAGHDERRAQPVQSSIDLLDRFGELAHGQQQQRQQQPRESV